MKIVVTGAAGLVGQNLLPRLKARGHTEIVAIDKHPANVRTLRDLHPDIAVIEADLAVPGPWTEALKGCEALVIGHAQIGGLDGGEFERNNVAATENLLAAFRGAPRPYVVHISSSVVNSVAVDWYTESKKAQEALVVGAGFADVVLRPTLMFGWFDRKHLGWLARFMKRSPVFPIPGNGRYIRQPLYVGDFCNIIVACLEQRLTGAYNISGQERIDYIDLIRLVRETSHADAAIVKIPYSLFKALLTVYALVDRNPPFTTKQLAALVTPDIFEVIDWPAIFSVRSTPLKEAFTETFNDPVYSKVVLEF